MDYLNKYCKYCREKKRLSEAADITHLYVHEDHIDKHLMQTYKHEVAMYCLKTVLKIRQYEVSFPIGLYK